MIGNAVGRAGNDVHSIEPRSTSQLYSAMSQDLKSMGGILVVYLIDPI